MEAPVFMIGFAGLLVYMIPFIVAAQRRHPQRASIGIVNFFLGWTLIGWVGSLAWAVLPIKQSQ
jgi:hypothetical protein